MTRIEDIRAREQAATRGPWEYDVNEGTVYTTKYVSWKPGHESCSDCAKDGDFLAHARTDIPYLLDLVERAEELIVLATTVWLLDSPRGRSSTAEQWLRDVRGVEE